MDTPEPRLTRSVDAPAWSPPLPKAPGFDHLVIETPGLRTHVASISDGEPAVSGECQCVRCFGLVQIPVAKVRRHGAYFLSPTSFTSLTRKKSSKPVMVQGR